MNTPAIRELGNGLVLRAAAPEDADALVDLQIHAFANPDTGELEEYLGGWTRDLLRPGTSDRPRHPTFRPGDFLIVEETATGKLVSCACLISQTWTYEDIPFGVGRIEIVGTDENYRRRGLIREQFRVLHEMSAARGELVQGITGIPYYYRQFGYEYALAYTSDRQSFIPQQIPAPPQGGAEPFRLRRAERGDFDFIQDVLREGGQRWLVNCQHDFALLEYEQYHEREPKNGGVVLWYVIESADGKPAGVLLMHRISAYGRWTCYAFEIAPHVNWNQVAPSVLRQLAQLAPDADKTDDLPISSIGWRLPDEHPLYTLGGIQTAPLRGGYAWFLRVADLPAFLQLIAPVLERRLIGSPFEGYTGQLRINFYRDGLEMVFEQGKLVAVTPWQATAYDYGQSGFGNAAFPDLTFLKLLFGYRSRSDLDSMFPDMVTDGTITHTLLDVLFPKRPSHVVPVH